MSRSWSRRHVLRGAVRGMPVALALPALEVTLGRRARADGVPDPIFGMFFWANGVPWHAGHGGNLADSTKSDVWTPAETGAGFTPSPPLTLVHTCTPELLGESLSKEVPVRVSRVYVSLGRTLLFSKKSPILKKGPLRLPRPPEAIG